MNEQTLIYEAVELIEKFMVNEHCADTRLLKAHDMLCVHLTRTHPLFSNARDEPKRQLPVLVTGK